MLSHQITIVGMQIERHYANGVKEIVFPDKTRKVISTNGLQVRHFLQNSQISRCSTNYIRDLGELFS